MLVDVTQIAAVILLIYLHIMLITKGISAESLLGPPEPLIDFPDGPEALYSSFRFIQEDILRPGVILAIQEFALVEVVNSNVTVLVGHIESNPWPSVPFGRAMSFVQLTDNTSQILLADTNHGCIRLIERRTWIVTPYSGNCSLDEDEQVDGDLSKARFAGPYDLALDQHENVLVTDKLLIRQIELRSNDTIVTTVYEQFVDPELHFWIFHRLIVTPEAIFATRYKAGLNVFTTDWRLKRVSRPRFIDDQVLETLRGNYRIPPSLETFEAIEILSSDRILVSLPRLYGVGSLAILNLNDDSLAILCPGVINSEVSNNESQGDLRGLCQRVADIEDMMILNGSLITASRPALPRNDSIYNLSGLDKYKLNDHCLVKDQTHAEQRYSLHSIVTIYQPNKLDTYTGGLICSINTTSLTAQWNKQFSDDDYDSEVYKYQLYPPTTMTTTDLGTTDNTTWDILAVPPFTSQPAEDVNKSKLFTVLGTVIPIVLIIGVAIVVTISVVKIRKRNQRKAAKRIQISTMTTTETCRGLPPAPHNQDLDQEEYDMIGEQYYSSINDNEKATGTSYINVISTKSIDFSGYVMNCQHAEPDYVDVLRPGPEDKAEGSDDSAGDRPIYILNAQIAYAAKDDA